ncbi:MAG: 4-phosphoerythronate dehydrogenase [Porphyromonas sp.]|nr:4-phosphoerythronate dehydrogenase [Porphyromonas sp.]
MANTVRPRVVAETSVPYLRGVLEEYAIPLYLDNADITQENIQDCDALIVRSITRCNAQLLEGTKVRYIATATAGCDHIDDEYCLQQGIAWDNAPGCNAIAVAQYVFSTLSLLSLRQGLHLWDKTIGIIGVGNVGRQVERIAKALGMRILRYDPPRAAIEGNEGFVSLGDIQREADIITLHVPLTEETRHMVNESFLASCQRKPILINACRGPVTDSAALIKAREAGQVRHLIIDCWEGEPHPQAKLLALADIATPHIAGFSADGKHRGARMALLSYCRHFGIEATESLLIPKELQTPSQIIDLSIYPEDEIIARAFLATFSPADIDSSMRKGEQTFEYLRKHYPYPREMAAHRVRCHHKGLAYTLSQIGFQISD